MVMLFLGIGTADMALLAVSIVVLSQSLVTETDKEI